MERAFWENTNSLKQTYPFNSTMSGYKVDLPYFVKNEITNVDIIPYINLLAPLIVRIGMEYYIDPETKTWSYATGIFIDKTHILTCAHIMDPVERKNRLYPLTDIRCTNYSVAKSHLLSPQNDPNLKLKIVVRGNHLSTSEISQPEWDIALLEVIERDQQHCLEMIFNYPYVFPGISKQKIS
ncbi:unnamed protein product [Didymodactylos carnosus]|uniref:Serine protease n=1 Tax=Didymodactylos carnosus TaxID=1234261 RepID=A0A814FLC7_9BILA|nr:unnamed protein product [Didymodactylos carnosus]CAF0982885.1 unnamed protein product [Didymodactylos carnosus]CAF3616752.1 unnamed protein product [Didymodactylos carnosus]CAF3755321.1 unnamed protein product [Didymodactylos carnosus]